MDKRIIIFAFVVLFTWALWTYGFSLAFNLLTELVGFPENSVIFLSMLLSLSFFMGFIPSMSLYKALGVNKTFLSFIFVLAIGLLSISGAGIIGGYLAVIEVLKSNGFWAFIIGAYAGAHFGRKILLRT